jgi:glyoxylase-like metal-dependent hydrolase (beta-lactamase superfamily II)
MKQDQSSQQSTLVRPQVYQFKLGDALVTNLLEGHIVRKDLHPFVATNATAEQVEALAEQYQIPFPELEHSFTTTLVETAGKLIAFDPGFGENSPLPTAGYFSQSLSLAGYSIDDIDAVVISHSHPDHIGNLMTAGAPTFPKAEIIYGRREFDYWKSGDNIAEFRKPTLALFQKVALPLAERIRFIEPDETIAPGITAVEAFGHSAGHLAFHIESAGKQLMMLNDTVAHYVASFAQPDWAFSMDDDPDAAAITRRRILTRVSQAGIPVIGFHIPFPSIGFVEALDSGFKFNPASYHFNV